MPDSDPVAIAAGRGALAGMAGTATMTGFQVLVEMPLTGRDESYAPADLVVKLLPVAPKRKSSRRRLNYGAHFGVGVAWGVGHALIARRLALRGPRAVVAVFAALYGGDVIANTALGLTKPWQWSFQDAAVDIADKLVLAGAVGLVFDLLRGEAGRGRVSNHSA